jgi:hypothetical protein
MQEGHDHTLCASQLSCDTRLEADNDSLLEGLGESLSLTRADILHVLEWTAYDIQYTDPQALDVIYR